MSGPNVAAEQFRSAFEHAPIGMVVSDLEGRWMLVNFALAQLLGRTIDGLAGRSSAEFTHPDDIEQSREALDALVGGDLSAYQMEKRFIHADGHAVWVSVSVALVRDDHGDPSHLISQVQDISERKATERELTARAVHDPLTGLPNRVLFLDRTHMALARMQRPHSSLAVFFVDLDRFKRINDSFGHVAGDRLLQQVANRLRSLLRPSDTVSRFGGDEFTVLCEATDEEAASGVAGRIAAALARPFLLGEHDAILSASIGVTVCRDPEDDPESLLRDADSAMYRAKQLGPSRFVIFEPGMRLRDPLRMSDPELPVSR
jgi:diguanylate cyclase (GGDEF)-like protein/PAS domain S-box-containing protein